VPPPPEPSKIIYFLRKCGNIKIGKYGKSCI
jgi:hypothetical protein